MAGTLGQIRGVDTVCSPIVWLAQADIREGRGAQRAGNAGVLL